MIYRLAEESELEAVFQVVASAIVAMENNGIFQWDDIYPAREDFLDDMKQQTLFVGLEGQEIAVVFTINEEYDEQYRNGDWKYPDAEFRIIHRLCVDPKFQGQGVAGKTLDHIEEELRQSGVETIRLDAFYHNPSALALYRNRGYEAVGTADFRKGNFYLMEKHL